MYVGQVMILLRTVSFKFFSYSARAYVLSKITGRQKGELPWDFHWENKTYKSKWFIEPYVKNDLDGEKKQILCILDKSLCFGFEVRFVTCLTKCLRFPLVVSVLLRSFSQMPSLRSPTFVHKSIGSLRLPRRLRPRKRRLKSEFPFF